jgi:hypothetical protein
MLPDYFVALQQDTVLQQRQSDYSKDSVLSTSMWDVKKMIIEKIDDIWKNVTWLIRSTLASCCTPTSPIWFHQRFTVVNVYVRCEKNDYRENK